ncbi:class I SAM-dependent methyltransferase [Campylobacter jejuni]|uniref:class I SAM-dependent methyltransferase n=1 Tax=Campylobacter jejuni TaxID=197 RepID=UPI002AA0D926|nr:class I SAM-dependent methyltransferase [Campylobacter jejuni]
MLLHSILAMFEGKTNAWIDKYIFPGGYLPSLREVVSAMSEWVGFLLWRLKSMELRLLELLFQRSSVKKLRKE